jgi:4-hydroxy-tetrahydrodipicolinate synthase
MTGTRIEGSFVALITPFNADGSIDFGAFRSLIDWHAKHGTAALLIMGSTGEVSMLEPAERQSILERTTAMKPAGLRLFFGCSGASTAATIANLRHARAAGADGAILAAPAYICASEADIEAHFHDCADATDLPIGLYNNPPRVKTDLGHEHLLRLLRHPNITVLKESTARVGQVAQVLAAKPDAAILCCDSPNLGLVVPTMALGGHGTANMTGNLDPAGMATLSTPWRTPEQAAIFRETYLRLLPLLHFTYSAINPVAVKSLMKAVGLPAGDLRRPLRALPRDQVARGIAIVQALGLERQYGWRLPPEMPMAAD